VGRAGKRGHPLVRGVWRGLCQRPEALCLHSLSHSFCCNPLKQRQVGSPSFYEAQLPRKRGPGLQPLQLSNGSLYCDSRVEGTAWPGADMELLLWDVHREVVTETTQRTYLYQATDASAASMGVCQLGCVCTCAQYGKHLHEGSAKVTQHASPHVPLTPSLHVPLEGRTLLGRKAGQRQIWGSLSSRVTVQISTFFLLWLVYPHGCLAS
jgi:hypothetical protein